MSLKINIVRHFPGMLMKIKEITLQEKANRECYRKQMELTYFPRMSMKILEIQNRKPT